MRNVQQIQITKNPAGVAFADIGGVTAEEVNFIQWDDIFDTSEIETLAGVAILMAWLAKGHFMFRQARPSNWLLSRLQLLLRLNRNSALKQFVSSYFGVFVISIVFIEYKEFSSENL